MRNDYYNHFVYPRKNIFGAFLNLILNNILFIRFKRVLFSPFTKSKLKSDIKNAVYLNWLVPVQKVEHLIPEHVKIRSYNGDAILTVLTYNHGHFRPVLLNAFKKYFSSPLQSNWRLYVENNGDFQVAEPTVYFVKNIMNNLTYTIGSRVVSNILQTHLPDSFEHYAEGNQITTQIRPGYSNAPDLYVKVKNTPEWKFQDKIKSIFPDHIELINTICNQDFAVSNQPDKNKYSIAKINLEFNPSQIIPLEVIDFRSEWLNNIIFDSACFAFLIPEITFTTLKERIITINTNGNSIQGNHKKSGKSKKSVKSALNNIHFYFPMPDC